MNIKIFVRHCVFSSRTDAVTNRPHFFNKEGCFNNLLNTVDDKCEITVLFDGNLLDCDHFLNREIYRGKFNLVEKQGGSETKSFLNMIEYVKAININDDDIVYFLEDDYFHNVGWPTILREGFGEYFGNVRGVFRNGSKEYVTLYDHNDKYCHQMFDELTSKIIYSKSVHWRTTPSTTNTYAMLGKTFKRDYDIHKKYSNSDANFTHDHAKFIHLGIDGRYLISCIPGYSTHCLNEHMSPLVDWEKVYNQTCNL